MDYTHEIAFDGDLGRAFDLICQTLTVAGFAMPERSASHARFTGPGMTSTRESPLLGAGEILVTAREGRLTLEADLAGVRNMQRFITWFPPGLTLVLGLLLWGLLLIREVRGPVWIAPALGAGLAVFFVLAFLPMRRLLRGRTQDALRNLIENTARSAAA